MFKNILKFFFDDSSKSYSFTKLYTQLSKWSKAGALPYDYELPQVIKFEDSFWKKIIQIHNETKNDNHERAFSIFWADGELIITGTTRGTTNSVQTNSTVSVKYVQSRHKGYYSKQIFVDSELYSSKDIYYKNINRNIVVQYLFNIHTHPVHLINGSEYYGFFSFTDINTLINSNAIITGMIGDKFWLLFKTIKSPRILNNYEESEINIQSLNEKIKLGVYCGEFGKKLIKVQ